MKKQIKSKIMKRVSFLNNMLRKELLRQLKKKIITMTVFEERTGLAHSFIFNWRDGKVSLRNIENFITIVDVLQADAKTSINFEI